MTEKVQASSDSYKKQRKKGRCNPANTSSSSHPQPSVYSWAVVQTLPFFSSLLGQHYNPWVSLFLDTINTILSHLDYIFFFPINGGLLRSFLIFLSHGSKASKYCFRSAVMLQPYFQSNGLFSASPTFLHYSLYISNVWEINMLCL